MLAPSNANIAGALHGPVKCSPVRQVIAPRPKSPPTPKANLMTEGITMTHSALLRRSFGIPSGISIISLNTWPQLRRRFCSLLSSAANVGHDRNTAMTKTQAFFMMRLPGQVDTSLLRRLAFLPRRVLNGSSDTPVLKYGNYTQLSQAV